MSCDEYIEIFNNVIGAKSYAFNYFEKRVPKSFKNLYMFKRGEVLSTLGILKPKWSIKYSTLLLMDLNRKDLRANRS